MYDILIRMFRVVLVMRKIDFFVSIVYIILIGIVDVESKIVNFNS